MQDRICQIDETLLQGTAGPNSGHEEDITRGPTWATTGLMRRKKLKRNNYCIEPDARSPAVRTTLVQRDNSSLIWRANSSGVLATIA
jgi:hypothetical protein